MKWEILGDICVMDVCASVSCWSKAVGQVLSTIVKSVNQLSFKIKEFMGMAPGKTV